MLLLGTQVLTLIEPFPATNIQVKNVYMFVLIKYLTEDVVVLFK